MIIYNPCNKTKPHPMRNEIIQIYLKYKDDIWDVNFNKRGLWWKIKKVFGVINLN